MLIGMKTQFSNTVEKLETDSLRAVTVVNNDTGTGIVCNATAEELIAKYGTIKNFFNDLFEKGIKALRITDKLKNGSTFRKFGDEYVFEFAPIEVSAVAPAPQEPLNGGMNAGMNGTIFRDMHYPMIANELEVAKAEVKRLTEQNRTLETKLLVNDTLDGKSTARSESNAKILENALPIVLAAFEKLTTKPVATVPGLSGVELSEVKKNGVKMMSQINDDIVNNINWIMLKSGNPQIEEGIMALAEMAEKIQ
jgi:hypothetical protein